jgi:flagellar biosynthesis protein FliQ
MRILIDDKPVETLTPKQEKTFFLAKVQEAVKGRILTPEEATAVFIAQTKQWFMIIGAIGLVLMVGILIAAVVGDPDNWLFIPFGLALFGALALFMKLMLRYRLKVFTRKIAHRLEGLMPVGTVLAIDGAGLSVGPETFAWPTLAIDTVELSTGSLPSGDSSTDIMLVERLSVAAGPKVFMLDRAMTENGMLLIDNVWRRLRAAAHA